MKLLIEIDMDNAAFEDSPGSAVETILSQVTNTIYQNENIHDYKVGHWDTVRDQNGNSVCTVSIAS